MRDLILITIGANIVFAIWMLCEGLHCTSLVNIAAVAMAMYFIADAE